MDSEGTKELYEEMVNILVALTAAAWSSLFQHISMTCHQLTEEENP